MKANSMTVTIGQRGVVTIPREIRESYHLESGDELTLLDLDGCLLLKPGRSEVDELAERIGRKLRARGANLQSLLMEVREERERYGRRGKGIR